MSSNIIVAISVKFHKWVVTMTEMLTAKEMESLLQVDRSTIYRMAEAGRLPAIKVGKQWRFPSEEVDKWMGSQITTDKPATARKPPSTQDDHEADLKDILPLECVQLIQDTFAELLGVMLVVTDMNGSPITEPSKSCGLFEAVRKEPQALERCIQSWHDLATTIDLEPKFCKSSLGLLCSRAMIRVGSELKGMVIGGCVAPESWPPSQKEISQMALKFGVPKAVIRSEISEVYFLTLEQQQQVLNHIQRIANIIAHIVEERRSLVGRLAAIANLTTI